MTDTILYNSTFFNLTAGFVAALFLSFVFWFIIMELYYFILDNTIFYCKKYFFIMMNKKDKLKKHKNKYKFFDINRYFLQKFIK